eukprot:6290223-Prymnesium_polylepis.1
MPADSAPPPGGPVIRTLFDAFWEASTQEPHTIVIAKLCEIRFVGRRILISRTKARRPHSRPVPPLKELIILTDQQFWR